MSYTEHKVVQDRSIPTVASALVRENLPVLSMFHTFAPDKYFHQEGGKVNLKVPGALPSRKYEWRNDRRKPILVDTYEETTITLDVGAPENHYSAVELADEQKEYDLNGSFGELTVRQTTAIVNTLNSEARNQILHAPYELGIGVDVSSKAIKDARELGQDAIYNGFLKAQAKLNQMGVPSLSRAALVGSQVAMLLKQNAKLDKVQGNNSAHAFADAQLGNYAGFNIIEDTTGLVPADEALLIDASGFLFWSYAPAIPEAAIRGARTNQDGVALRWVVDYDPSYMVERSVWNSWNSFGLAKDFVIGIDTNGDTAYGTEQYFAKGVHMIFRDGTGGWEPGDGVEIDNGRKGASPESELALWFNNEPLKAGREFKGAWMPSVLRGDVQIGESVGGDAGDGEGK